MIITDCKVNHLKNPIGYLMEKVDFSWKVKQADGTKRQVARIRIAKDCTFETSVLDTGYSEELDSIVYETNLNLEAYNF